MERFSEGVSFAEDDRPAQPGLEHAQGQCLEHARLVIRAGAPDLVVVTAECGVARSGPGAPRSSFVSVVFVAPLLLLRGPPLPSYPMIMSSLIWLFAAPRPTDESLASAPPVEAPGTMR